MASMVLFISEILWQLRSDEVFRPVGQLPLGKRMVQSVRDSKP